MKIFSAAAILSLASAVMAFEATAPCLMWSPRNYIEAQVNTAKQLVISKSDANDFIMSSLSPDICSAKLIALVNQPEIHKGDFSRSGYEDAFTHLKEQNEKAQSRSQIGYVAEGVDIQKIAKDIASKCDSSIAILDASTVTSDDLVEQDTPIVAVVYLPAANDNVETLKANDDLLGKLIHAVEEKVENDYVVIYTSSDAKKASTHTLHRRAPQPVKNLPIFAKYQLFTPGVFMVLGVVFLLLLIAGTGITWLVGIQTPVRFEAKQKKN
ncbi:vacuolar ATP synthase subunit S1-domain-containing protein [Mucor mucedo]|uniref:vacuolar ATP synthase subunit S1-domain-containing protein n=1 Tax=Mucor mucedo TaxID=29922 RepID=UPI0022206979|nr:vacuolar ATP synthase subunit S1-domain-containing protein [Mucor mucedo]KAI7888853.1 vacuolar ATP synthase subunit S1-domain-containing protein [Mucor mucedo]